MLKRFLRCISTLLVLVMLVNIVPVQALDQLQAGEIGQISGTEPITTTPMESADIAEPATIVAEIPEGRSEYTKEFLLSNGLHIATVYAQPVHYEKDGKWEDIDNTLVANTDGTYKNTAGPWEVAFPQSFGGNQGISVTKNGYTLSFGMPLRLTSGGNSGAAVMSTDGIAESFSAVQAATATAQLDDKMELAKAKAEADHPETVLDKLSSRLTYEDIHSDTDVIYDLTSNQVKESIVLAKQDAALRGFRYTLNTGSMIPVLEEDGTILLYNETQTEIVMVMPAPYLLDAAYEISTDISVSITGDSGSYVLTYLLPQSWLAAEDRQWPVILDPVIQTSIERSNIQDILVCSDASISAYGSFLEVGYLTNRGISRSYVNFSELPKLTSSDVVISAKMQMTQMYYRSISVPAEVHKVTEAWDQEEITWDTQPAYDETIVDFVMGKSARDYYWNVTDIVQEWYNDGEHFGLLFKTSDIIENEGTEKFRQFFSANYGYDNRPVLKVTFRNNNGLESFWDYSSTSAGRAGTGHVNNYTGNLVWVRSDMGFGGNRMPAAISHIYNANDSADNRFSMGYGWRTNYNQLVYQWDEDGDGIIQSDEEYYVWEDSDGTRHYFEKESANTYTDEDGLELTLTVSGSDKIITNKSGNKSHFDSQGRLYREENNQQTVSALQIAYSETDPLQISAITDGAGRVYRFTYENGLLTQIRFMGLDDTLHTYVSYGYTDGNLTAATYKDNAAVSYGYNSNRLLTSATDVDGYRLEYTYSDHTADYAPYRVIRVQEFDGEASGGGLMFAYEGNQTILTDVVNGTSLTSQFNNWGNTVAVYDDEGRAQYGAYARNEPEDTAGKGNQLTLSSKMQNTVINLLSDGSFEGGTPWEQGSIAQTGYLGEKSLQITGGSSFSSGITVSADETYTFSGYVKTADSAGKVKLGITDGNTTCYSEEISAPGWTRLQVSYTNTGEADQTIYAIFSASATAYLDCVQLEKMPTASRYNLISNGDFGNTSGWIPQNLSAEDTVTTAPDAHTVLSASAYKITGEYATAKSVKQTVTVSGSEGDSFVFGGWAMGQSAALKGTDESVAKDFAIKCTIYNGTEIVQEESVQFNSNVTQWQFVSGAIAATGDYTAVTVEAVYANNANTVYFDGLQLFKEEFGVSYAYDDDGNITSVIDLQKKETTYDYDDNNNLTQIIEGDKVKMSYTYDSWQNVLTATTEEGQCYTFTYDGYGNNLTVSITEGGKTVSSSAVYTENGNLPVSATDALGNTTTYGYDANTGLLTWVQYPEDTENTRTEYTYDEMYRAATATANLYRDGADTQQDLSVSYTYENDLLKTIQTPSTTYVFEYGSFSLRSGIKIGGNTLVSYDYESQTNRLRKQTYGNQDYVEYTYDSQGRLLQETYEDGETVSYAYDNVGNLATVTDSETGIVTTYYYDLLNRLSGYRETGENLDHSVLYFYDSENNLSSMTETVNGVDKNYTYTYNEDNRLIAMTADGITVEYTYDDFGRLENRVIKNGDTVIDTYEVGYQGTDTTTSGQIASYNGFTYTYDGNGNILSVSDGTHTTSYAYDSANQLIRENNQAGNFTHTWEYDNAGNILERREYAYTTGELGELLSSKIYAYNSSIWGDLVYTIGDNKIRYDGVGNPVAVGNMRLTWKHGRQLTTLNTGSSVWSFTYDAGGMRTGRTNGTRSYTYVYHGDKLTAMTRNADTFYFTYDASGVPLTVTWNGTRYYYRTNLQGDVIDILDGSGNTVVSYVYDAWGRLLGTTGTLASTLGSYNPLRYRGYVYDQELSLYYLQSRYYNPTWGRFLNADALVSTGQGFIGNNMFAYCNNNPINGCDPCGTCKHRLDFWNDCEKCGGMDLYGKMINALDALIVLFQKTEKDNDEETADRYINDAFSILTNVLTETAEVLTEYTPSKEEILVEVERTSFVLEGVSLFLASKFPNVALYTGIVAWSLSGIAKILED